MTGVETRADHHGIPVLWADLPVLFQGSLSFAVGGQNEPMRMSGITHLLEHIILNLMQPITVWHHGVSSHESVSFTAWGEPDDVAAFLNSVADSVRHIDRLSDRILWLEKRSVEAENCNSFAQPSSGLLTYRYGFPGLGNSNFGTPAIAGLTREHVIDWSTEWLVTGNAALSFTGAPPDSLRVVLPSADAPRSTVRPVGVETPVLVSSKKQGVALSLIVDEAEAEILGEALRLELLADLRYTRGLIYAADVFHTRLDETTSELAFILDPPARRTAKTLRTALSALRRLSRHGFSASTVRAVQCNAANTWNHPETRADSIQASAVDLVFGRTSESSDSRLEASRLATSESLRKSLNRYLDTLLVAYDSGEVTKDDLPSKREYARDDFWVWQPVAPDDLCGLTTHSRTWVSRSGKYATLLSASHIVEVSSRRPIGIAFADMALVTVTPGKAMTIVDSRGRSTVIDRTDAVKLDSLVVAILARLAPELVVTL